VLVARVFGGYGGPVSEPFKPVLTITTTAANVADLKATQYRWACPCGEHGPWVDSETEAAVGAGHHSMLDFFGRHRGVHLESVGAFTGQEQG